MKNHLKQLEIIAQNKVKVYYPQKLFLVCHIHKLYKLNALNFHLLCDRLCRRVGVIFCISFAKKNWSRFGMWWRLMFFFCFVSFFFVWPAELFNTLFAFVRMICFDISACNSFIEVLCTHTPCHQHSNSHISAAFIWFS